MNERSIRLSLVAAAAGILACTTTLETSKLSLESKGPETGWDYSLPFARFDISITRALTKCDVDVCTEQCANDVCTKHCNKGLSVDASASATTVYERDPSQTYTIDYRSLSSWTKTSDFQIQKYPNGMLKQIGVAAEDRTGPIIINTVTGLVKLAETAAIVAGGGAPARRAESICNADTRRALRVLPGLKKKVQAARASLDVATAELKGLTSASAAMDNRPSAATQRALVAQTHAVVLRQTALDRETAAYVAELAKVTEVQTLAWPPDGHEISIVNTIKPETLTGWLRDDLAFIDEVPVTLALIGDTALALPAGSGQESPSRSVAIHYRLPVNGKLILCKGKSCPATPTEGVQTILAGPVPQLGRVYLLPFTNGIFENNALSATFAEDGSLTTAGYTEKTSRGETASDTFEKVAAALPQAVKDIRTAGFTAKADELNAQASALEAKANLEKAKAALQPSPTDALEQRKALVAADTDLKDAERANIEATLALREAQAKARAAE